MTSEQYIEHEIQLRVMNDTSVLNFKSIDERLKTFEAKLNWIISLVVGGWFLPLLLHYAKTF